MTDPKKNGTRKGPKDASEGQLTDEIRDRILRIISEIPESTQPVSADPEKAVRALIARAALDSAGISGALALPTGPLGLLTILPDLAAIWKRQAKLVADIAAVHGKTEELDRETMLYCLFKHAAAQAVADLTVRVVGRQLRRLSTRKMLQAAAQRAGIAVSRKVIRKAAVRWVPIIGAIGVAGYAYYDTASVGQTARGLFAPKHRKKAARRQVSKKITANKKTVKKKPPRKPKKPRN